MALVTTRLDWPCVTEGESAILGAESLGNHGGLNNLLVLP